MGTFRRRGQIGKSPDASRDVQALNPYRFDAPGNDDMTKGLTINQGANDDEILALKSSDVAHGVTDSLETDTFGRMKKQDAAAGGLDVLGASEDDVALALKGVGVNDDTGKATTARAYVEATGFKKSGTAAGAPGANANIFGIRSQSNTRFIVDAEGDIHYDGTASAYDEFADAELVRAVDLELAGPGLIEGQFDEFVRYSRDDLERLGLVTFNEDGHHFINMTRLQKLHNGAVWQLYAENQELRQRLDRLETLLLTEGVQ